MKKRSKSTPHVEHRTTRTANVVKKYVVPEFLAGLGPDDLLRKLVQKAGGDPDVIAGNTTAVAITEAVTWSESRAKELDSYRTGGTKKAGKVYEPKASIRTICARLRSTEYDVVLAFLRDDADGLADLYESNWYEMNLHNVFIDDEADDGAGRVYFVLRGKAATPENTKSISTKRLADILREIRKESRSR